MAISEILVDAYGRISEEVTAVLDGIDAATLAWRADPEANTIGWLVWHLIRVEDDHLAAAFGQAQVWDQAGFSERFDLPFDPAATGYGQSPAEVAQVRPEPDLLRSYADAVGQRAGELVAAVTDADLGRVVDDRWDPPVTLGVRLVSVIGDCLQHVGQAAFVRGLAERAGLRP